MSYSLLIGHIGVTLPLRNANEKKLPWFATGAGLR